MRCKPYGLPFRGKNAVFPLKLGRAALCRASHFAIFKGKMLYRLNTGHPATPQKRDLPQKNAASAKDLPCAFAALFRPHKRRSKKIFFHKNILKNALPLHICTKKCISASLVCYSVDEQYHIPVFHFSATFRNSLS
ncbi:hypothetical protein, partial [uncultured Desulfovibrio sp.]|uniref:hypothetical protein n=1 Tax=uncultured Desulfovibrio sp. TaxID=167968 RepID=UPI002611A306